MSLSVWRASAIRRVCRSPRASRYRTSRFSGNAFLSDAAALTASSKRRSLSRARILCTSSSTPAGATGCDVTVMASSKKQRADIAVRPSIVPPAVTVRGACRQSELQTEFQAKDARTQRHFGLDVLTGGRVRAGVRVGEVLAVDHHVPRILRDAERRVKGIVGRLRVAQPRGGRNEDALTRGEAARLVVHRVDVVQAG